MRKLYVPALGDQLTLAEDWTFHVVNAHQNCPLVEWMGLPLAGSYWNPPFGRSADRQPIESKVDCMLPKGTILKVGRIYIRQGAPTYNSLTFTIVGQHIPKKVVKRLVHIYDGPRRGTTVEREEVQPRRPIRFFARLSDVNEMIIT